MAVLQQLSVGEALVSMLDENGTPQTVQRAKIVPPRSQVGAITPKERQQIIGSSVLAGHYEKPVDRESAYEKLQTRASEKTASAPNATPGASVPAPAQDSFFKQVMGSIGSVFKPTIGPRGGVHDSMATTMAKSAVRAAGSQVGRQIIRGVLGGMFGGRK